MFEELDSMKGRTDLYLHLLHSRSFAARVQRALAEPDAALPAGVRSFFEGIDFVRLAHEQDHRRGDLCAHLRRICPWHAAVVGDVELERLIAGYSDCPEFTLYRGRSLGEDYCLWAHATLASEGSTLAAEITRLDGVIAGMEAAPDKPSPWPTHEHEARRESYIGAYLFAFEGSGGREAPRALSQQPSRLRIEIEADGSVMVQCEVVEVVS